MSDAFTTFSYYNHVHICQSKYLNRLCSIKKVFAKAKRFTGNNLLNNLANVMSLIFF